MFNNRSLPSLEKVFFPPNSSSIFRAHAQFRTNKFIQFYLYVYRAFITPIIFTFTTALVYYKTRPNIFLSFLISLVVLLALFT